MKKIQGYLFVPIGILLCSASQITAHYIEVPDFVSGLSMGVGIGIMVLAFIKPKRGSLC